MSEVTELNHPQAMGFLIACIDMVSQRQLVEVLIKNTPKSLSEQYDRGDTYIDLEEAFLAHYKEMVRHLMTLEKIRITKVIKKKVVRRARSQVLSTTLKRLTTCTHS